MTLKFMRKRISLRMNSLESLPRLWVDVPSNSVVKHHRQSYSYHQYAHNHYTNHQLLSLSYSLQHLCAHVRFQSTKSSSTITTFSSDFKDLIASIEDCLIKTRQHLNYIKSNPNYAQLKEKIESVQDQVNLEELWMSDAKEAISVQQQIANLKSRHDTLSSFEFQLDQCSEMKKLGIDEKDLELLSVVEQDASDLEKDCHEFYLKTLMSQEIDKNGCFIELRSGAGGVEACDWVEMLTRMYERWGVERGYRVEVVDFVRGEIAGYKTSTISVQGEYAFGWAKYETGVHRFVRCSPFDSQGKRHTSFVSVQVIPQVGKGEDGGNSSKEDDEIPSRDIKLEVMRSQGAGGQHVNKTESAVRMTHIPTGITVFCQHDRSQHRNKAMAMEMLKSKLYAKRQSEEDEEKKQLYSQQSDVAWGNQIRSYVLHPYHLVKDSRTNYQTSNVQSVLDGSALQSFMQATVLNDKINKKS